MSTRRLNPDVADTRNFLKINADICDCSGGTLAICQHTATVTEAAGAAFVNVVIDGTTYPAAGLTVGDEAGVQAFLVQSLKDAGYFDIDNTTWTHDGAAWTINHVGQATIDSVETAAGVEAITAACTEVITCDYVVVFNGGTDVDIIINGVAGTLTGTFTYPADAPAVVQAALVAQYPAFTWLVEDATGAYQVTMTEPKGSSLVLDGRTADACNCRVTYTV